MTRRQDLKEKWLVFAELRLKKLEEIRELLSISFNADADEILRIMKWWRETGDGSIPAKLKSHADRRWSISHTGSGRMWLKAQVVERGPPSQRRSRPGANIVPPPYTRLGHRCSFIRELPAGNADVPRNQRQRTCLRQASDPEISRSLFGLLLHSQKAF